MILEAHRVAEFMNHRNNVACALVNDKTGAKKLSFTRLYAKRPYRCLESTQMLGSRIVARSSIQHAKRIDFAIVVGIIDRPVHQGVFFHHRKNGALHEGTFVSDILTERFAFAHQVHVKSRDKHARRLIDKIIPDGSQVGILSVVFLIQASIHPRRIKILFSISFHKNYRETEVSFRMARLRQYCRHPRCRRQPLSIAGYVKTAPVFQPMGAKRFISIKAL